MGCMIPEKSGPYVNCLNEIKAPSIVPGPSQTSAGCKKRYRVIDCGGTVRGFGSEGLGSAPTAATCTGRTLDPLSEFQFPHLQWRVPALPRIVLWI